MSTQTLDPVRVSVVVDVSVERAWEVFTDGISRWWPMESHSIEEAGRVELDPRIGGEIYEVNGDKRYHWGWIRAWEPPRRIVVEWKVNPEAAAPTSWETIFEPDGEATRVTLTHTGWEQLGGDATESRESYHSGWSFVLGRYESYLNG
jgi:uncharacterized protein YndB with AHSA1/START domain